MKFGKFTVARRLVALSLLALFIAQLFRLKWLIGGIAGSLVFGWLNLLDVFAFAESALATHSFTTILFYAVVPVLILYLILGRAFCGWVCPLDLAFQAVARLKRLPPPSFFSPKEKGNCEKLPLTLPSPPRGEGKRNGTKNEIPAPLRGEGRVGVIEEIFSKLRGRKGGQVLGYLVPSGFLIGAALFQVPFFTSYLSPLTNFYRVLYTGFFRAGGYPADFWVFALSAIILAGFLLLEFFQPRLWCRLLCPVGKTYGLFNRVNFLHVKMAEGACTGCRQCQAACYMGVKILPAASKKIREASCILCGRCVEACQDQEKILKMEFGK